MLTSWIRASEADQLTCPVIDEGSCEMNERSAKEVTHVGGAQLAPEGALVWNPAYDVTPHHLIAGIITERGICRAPYPESLPRAVKGD